MVAATLIAEKAKYDTFRVNGKEVTFTACAFDHLFVECDIANLLRRGRNEVVYSADFYQHDGVRFALFAPEATENLRNCLYFDTSIENVYVKGDFILDEGYAICAKKLPKNKDGIEKQGYPFFAGKVQYAGKYTYGGNGRAILTLDGDYLVAKITANGRAVEVVMDTQVDITDLLRVGENDIEITVNTSLRNLFGPHHAPLDAFIFPPAFTFRGQWENGKPEAYQDKLSIVNVGIHKISIKEIV